MRIICALLLLIVAAVGCGEGEQTRLQSPESFAPPPENPPGSLGPEFSAPPASLK
jgi:hypothetical protein